MGASIATKFEVDLEMGLSTASTLPLSKHCFPQIVNGHNVQAIVDHVIEHGFACAIPTALGSERLNELRALGHAMDELIGWGMFSERQPFNGQRYSISCKPAVKWFSREVLYMVDHPLIVQVCDSLVHGDFCHVTKYGGDWARGTVEFDNEPIDQAIHSDFGSCYPVPHAAPHNFFQYPSPSDPDHWTKHDRRPPTVCVSTLVHDIPEGMSSLRIMSWQDSLKWDGTESHADMLCLTLSPLPLGTIVFRDVRAPHSGTKNLHTDRRILPGCVLCGDTFLHGTSYRPAHRIMKCEFEESLKSARGHNDYMYDQNEF